MSPRFMRVNAPLALIVPVKLVSSAFDASYTSSVTVASVFGRAGRAAAPCSHASDSTSVTDSSPASDSTSATIEATEVSLPEVVAATEYPTTSRTRMFLIFGVLAASAGGANERARRVETIIGAPRSG
jgi:hypothetical protein